MIDVCVDFPEDPSGRHGLERTHPEDRDAIQALSRSLPVPGSTRDDCGDVETAADQPDPKRPRSCSETADLAPRGDLRADKADMHYSAGLFGSCAGG